MKKRLALAVLPLCVVAWGCRGRLAEAHGGEAAAVTVDTTDLFVVDSATIQTGPLLSGSLEPRQQATLRAEIGGTVRKVLVDEGQAVKQGAPLVELDSETPTQNVASARADMQSAEQQLRVARRNVTRMKRLLGEGAISESDLENTRNKLVAAQAQLASARAGLTQARKQLSDTRPVAPFNGVVSRRSVNAGDVVSPGAALVTIIDPFSLRLVASVPTADLSAVHTGAQVDFRVTGYPDRRFTGIVQRINPAANPDTRQVTLYIKIPNSDRDLVAGVYAQGRVDTEHRSTLVVPMAATDIASGQAAGSGEIDEIKQGRVQQVKADFGVVDRTSGLVEVQAGLQPGDTVLVGPARELTPGTPVRVDGQSAPPSRH